MFLLNVNQYISVCLCREDIYIKSESPSSKKEQNPFPEHNCNNILKVRHKSKRWSERNSWLSCLQKRVCQDQLLTSSTCRLWLLCSHLQYLSYCMGLCPRVYSDDELLLLLAVVGKVGLDTRLLLQSGVELYPLQYKIINNIRDWNTMVSSCMPRIPWNVLFFNAWKSLGKTWNVRNIFQYYRKCIISINKFNLISYYFSKMFSAAKNLYGPYWSDRWPPQHVPASSTAAWQHTWKVSLLRFFSGLHFLPHNQPFFTSFCMAH